MIPQGVFDTTSSMDSAGVIFAQMHISGSGLRSANYAGGCMVYSNQDGVKAFNADLRAFIGGVNLHDRLP
jgi:uncharacterized protein YjbI with pentapeptide repeats